MKDFALITPNRIINMAHIVEINTIHDGVEVYLVSGRTIFLYGADADRVCAYVVGRMAISQ